MADDAVVDSDLFEDIYGDDANEFIEVLDEFQQPQAEAPKASVPDVNSTAGAESKAVIRPPASTDLPSSLPTKPTVHPSSNQRANTSYSAQVAKQFSTYSQTSGQERLLKGPRTSTASYAIPTVDGSGVTPSGDTVFGMKPSEMHDAGKIFIGGLSWDTTDEGLRDYFSNFGKVDACTIMRDPAGTSRGFAFLTFEDPSCVQAVTSREHSLDGKSIDPKRAIPRDEHVRNTRYFVGGLSATTTSESMRLFFSAYGKVADATVMVDRDSGRGKGFGFVTFEDAMTSDQLVGKLGLILDDKQIEVKSAQPRSQREQSRSTNITGSPSHEHHIDKPMGTSPAMSLQAMNSQNSMGLHGQRFMNQIPMGGMNMTPMMGMGMGMGMGAGMTGMNMLNGMSSMNFMGQSGDMSPMGVFGNMAAMRMGMGMGPMGAVIGAGGMRTTPNINTRSGGVYGMGRLSAPTIGPNRTVSRGYQSFHPYAR